MRLRFLLSSTLCLLPVAAVAGPPFITDDPAPTDFGHYETYFFNGGSTYRGGYEHASGIDFNYGAAPDLQLTAAIPFEYDHPEGEKAVSGIGNIELAAKYRIAHQEGLGWDVAIFPRVFLKSQSNRVGDDHAALLVPIWVGKDFGPWSSFGGGGCVIQGGDDNPTYCQTGWAVTRQVSDRLRLGAEIVHQTADQKGGHSTTSTGAGLIYDLNEHYHLLAYAGPHLQNVSQTNLYNWYMALQVTY